MHSMVAEIWNQYTLVVLLLVSEISRLLIVINYNQLQ